MTIEQTVTITEDHWLHFELPVALPLGSARVELTVTPERTHAVEAWVNPLRGRAKSLGLQLSPERVLEMQREDVELENAIDERLRSRATGIVSRYAHNPPRDCFFHAGSL